MNIYQIEAILRPPPVPALVSSHQHEAIEEMYPFRFPEQFIEFCRIYGDGRIVSDYLELDIFNPLGRNYLKSRDQEFSLLVLLIGCAFLDGGSFPYNVIPNWPALVPFAISSAGFGVYWLISSFEKRSSPDFLIVYRDGTFQEVPGPFLEFMQRFLKADTSLFLWESFDIDHEVAFRFVTDR